MSTSGHVQCMGDIMIHVRGYHEYVSGCSVHWEGGGGGGGRGYHE